ncbi:bifunctional DNA primase/polymerase [Thalassospira xianhensis]|nr:bifunctional DNA primase/polymerase [Thalassospira xianhensis]
MADSITPDDSPSAQQQDASEMEFLYAPSESIFGATAPLMVANGWSVFPQYGVGRRPGKVNGETIKWAEKHDLANKLPDSASLALWCSHCATLNVACVFGPASGNTFAIDIDVTDEAMSREITAIADEILGYTPLRREGRSPKIALIYRQKDASERIPSISRHFADISDDGNANKSDQGLEILSAGKLITFHGRHHVTGSYFKWLDQSPLVLGPQDLPAVSEATVQTFLEAIDAKWRFHRGASFNAEGATWQWDETTKMHVPNLALAAGGSAWVENSEGLVSDGREAYLSHLVYRMITGNLPALQKAKDTGDAELDDFKQSAAIAVVEQFERTAELSGRWRLSNLRHEARDKVIRLVEKVLSGRIALRAEDTSNNRASDNRSFQMPKPRQVNSARNETAPVGKKSLPTEIVPAEVESHSTNADEAPAQDPEFDFLKPNKPGVRKLLKGGIETPETFDDLNLPQDRTEITVGIRKRLEESFTSFFCDVYGHETKNDFIAYGDKRKPRIHILIAPTGAGKTSLGIRFIAADPRTYETFKWIDRNTGDEREGRAPVVFLLPTYHNIDELRHRAQVLGLDPNLSDDELRKKAVDLQLIAEDELDGKIAELRRDAINCGLKTMTYSGKIKAGCAMEEKVEMAMSAGIGTAGFCKSSVKEEDGTIADMYCDHYGSCPAIRQRQEINNVHVVFLPHSFLSLTIPEELEHVRAVVADERIHHLFLHTATFSAMSLSIPRKLPRLTKKEKASGVMPEDLMAERDQAAGIALDAIRAGDCPAEALLNFRGMTGNSFPGPSLVKSAIRVCSSAIQKDANLSPAMTLDEVKELCAQPTGKDVREEWRFWKIIEERLEALQFDNLKRTGIQKLERELETFTGEFDMDERLRKESRLAHLKTLPNKACGAIDVRIQLLTDQSVNGGTTEVIRISWRSKPNWLGVPMLLLDASAAPPIIAKIWCLPEEDIVVHRVVDDIGKSLNVKVVGIVNQTFSNSSLIASPSSSEFERFSAAKNLSNVRQALTTVSSLYGDGRVVAGTSIVLREVINNGWVAPDNVDWCHFGAMRGLDMFKFHSAAFSVGRMEVPVRSIDGLVAALTYDDVAPEAPFDRLGTGMDPANPEQPLRLPMGDQRLRLRSGYIASIPVPMVPGRWGRMIQKQYREEELNQFVGRLRPVYREGRTPVWFALSSVIPEDLIVDELVHIDDLLFGPTAVWDAARRVGGILEPKLIATACPDLFPSEEAVKVAMSKLGFDCDTGETNGRFTRGYAKIRFRFAKSPSSEAFAFVMGHKANGLEHFIEIYRQMTDEEVFGTVMEQTDQTLARPREADKVELRIGAKEVRIAKADERFSEMGEILLSSPGDIEEKFSVKRFPVKVSSSTRHVSLPEMDAMLAIRDYWKSKSGAADDRVSPVLADAPVDITEGGDYSTYEHMSAMTNDELPTAADVA